MDMQIGQEKVDLDAINAKTPVWKLTGLLSNTCGHQSQTRYLRDKYAVIPPGSIALFSCGNYSVLTA
jgi:hypothetical protein